MADVFNSQRQYHAYYIFLTIYDKAHSDMKTEISHNCWMVLANRLSLR